MWAYAEGAPDFFLFRLLRGITCFIFLTLIYIAHGKKTNPLLGGFLFFYGLSSCATIWYEHNVIAIITMGLNCVAFLCLIRALLPKVTLRKMSTFLIVSGVIMNLINGYLLYLFLNMIQTMTLSSVHFLFIILNAMFLFLAAFCALLYNHTHSTRASLIFTTFMFLIVFCEVFRAIAYYDFAYGQIAVYATRGLLILAVAFLTRYTFAPKIESEQLNRRIF